MNRYPLTHKDVVSGLKAAGFIEQPKTATSHVKWKKYHNGIKIVVTVDEHLAPYSNDLVKSMAGQAYLSEKDFRLLCTKKGQKMAKKGEFGKKFKP